MAIDDAQVEREVRRWLRDAGLPAPEPGPPFAPDPAFWEAVRRHQRAGRPRGGWFAAPVLLAAALVVASTLLHPHLPSQTARQRRPAVHTATQVLMGIGPMAQFQMVTPTAGWAVTSAGEVLHTQSGPRDFRAVSPFPFPRGQGFWSWRVLSGEAVVIDYVPHRARRVLVAESANDGRSWTRGRIVLPGIAPGVVTQVAMAWRNPHDGVAVVWAGTSARQPAGYAAVYLTTSGGRTWLPWGSFTGRQAQSIRGVTLSYGAIYLTTNSFMTWRSANGKAFTLSGSFGSGPHGPPSTASTPPMAGPLANNPSYIDAGREVIWFFVSGRRAWLEAGSVGPRGPFPPPPSTLFPHTPEPNFAVYSTRDWWVASLPNETPGAGSGEIWRSTDGGQTWRSLGKPRGLHRPLAAGDLLVSWTFVSPETGYTTWAGGEGSGVTIMVTHDGGRTWSPLTRSGTATGPR
jgi:hypothetical protein